MIFAFGRGGQAVSIPKGRRAAVSNLRFASLDGKPWALADYRGKVVLVNFWATWCPPCRMETPDLVRVYLDYRDRGFTAAGVSMDEDGPEAVRQFVEEYHIPYPVLLPGDSDFAATVSTLPTSLLIDKYGRIARSYSGMIDGDELRRDIGRLLTE